MLSFIVFNGCTVYHDTFVPDIFLHIFSSCCEPCKKLVKFNTILRPESKYTNANYYSVHYIYMTMTGRLSNKGNRRGPNVNSILNLIYFVYLGIHKPRRLDSDTNDTFNSNCKTKGNAYSVNVGGDCRFDLTNQLRENLLMVE